MPVKSTRFKTQTIFDGEITGLNEREKNVLKKAGIGGTPENVLVAPSGLTKTKLVGVGTQGQENIEIGDNLTLANGKLTAAGGIPVVEGTPAELNEEEQNRGVAAKWTIPTAQSSNFIFHIADEEGLVLMSCLEGIYSCNFNVPGMFNYIFYGTETFIYLLNNTDPTNAISYCEIENFNDGDHNQQGFVMPTEDVVLFTNGSDTSLIGCKNGTSYYCYEWKPEIDGGLKMYKQFAYKISKSNVGFKIETVDISQALNYNLMFLPYYSSSDDGKILAIDSGNPKWVSISTPTITFED